MASANSLDSVVIRFAGDSGDGMQLTGTQFSNTSAVMGNDISTFPSRQLVRGKLLWSTD